MSDRRKASVHERWALVRFSVVGPLLASPPARGELSAEIEKLAERRWLHPVTGKPTRFGVSTIERWYYQARREKTDPVGVLRQKVRKDAGTRPAMGEKLQAVLAAQYAGAPELELPAPPRQPAACSPRRTRGSGRCRRTRRCAAS